MEIERRRQSGSQISSFSGNGTTGAAAKGIAALAQALPPGTTAELDIDLEHFPDGTIKREHVHAAITRLPEPGLLEQSTCTSTSGLQEIRPSSEFRPAAKVEGLDFGRQFMLRQYHLYMKEYPDYGLIIYTQSPRGKTVQGIYHVATLGIGSSVNKGVIFFFNEREDALFAREVWPRPDEAVAMEDLKSQTLDKMGRNYEFDRAKIMKGTCTIYLYYVKKSAAPVHRQRQKSWANLKSSINSMDNKTDWALVVSTAVGQMGQIASSVIG